MRTGAIGMSILAQKQIRLAYIAASYLTLTCCIFRAVLVSQATASDYFVGACLAVFVTMACVADSAVQGRAIPFEVRLPFSVTWGASLPIYLLRARGWWGALFLLVHLGLLIWVIITCAIANGIRTVLLN